MESGLVKFPKGKNSELTNDIQQSHSGVETKWRRFPQAMTASHAGPGLSTYAHLQQQAASKPGLCGPSVKPIGAPWHTQAYRLQKQHSCQYSLSISVNKHFPPWQRTVLPLQKRNNAANSANFFLHVLLYSRFSFASSPLFHLVPQTASDWLTQTKKEFHLTSTSRIQFTTHMYCGKCSHSK